VLIHRLKVSGLLSFGPEGIDLPLEGLNVLIGPNGSGKSNLLEVLALLKASPRNLSEPVRETGGVREWLWKGAGASRVANIRIDVDYLPDTDPVRHVLEITDKGGRLEVADESIEGKVGSTHNYYYQLGLGILTDRANGRQPLRREVVKPTESVLSQLRDPDRFPVFYWLSEQYERIRLHRNWSFGPSALLRQRQSAHDRSDFLSDGGENLVLVLSKVLLHSRKEFVASLRFLYDGIVDVHVTVDGGEALLFLEESGGRQIPATRLSDGTLRYLSLLAILLHPDPPPLVAIEEPELGLHPDVVPHIAELLVQASQRMQLVVTTHSRLLVDALSEHPSSVVVCGKENGESRFERLDGKALKAWLEKYSLGSLWSMGELGGNRW
jgi:predicted ATPase